MKRNSPEEVIVNSPKVFSVFSSDLACRIFAEFVNPSCPMDIAKKLGMHEQKVYYYIRKFRKAGLIREVSRQQRKGTIARFYAASGRSFTFSTRPSKPAASSGVSDFGPFVLDGKMNCRIIVGSPDPHGPYKARSSDSCCAIDLALFIGSFISGPCQPSYKLDVEVRKKDLEGNLILVGGPVANTITGKLNRFLAVNFDMESMAVITSSLSGKSYGEDNYGLISLTANPFDRRGSILLLAGNRFLGTRAAVIAVMKDHRRLLRSADSRKGVSHVVRGFDMDGDGVIDGYELIE